jgi:hypothetical protein
MEGINPAKIKIYFPASKKSPDFGTCLDTKMHRIKRNATIRKLCRFISTTVKVKKMPNEIVPKVAIKLVSEFQTTKLIAENHDIKKQAILKFAVKALNVKASFFIYSSDNF